MPSDVTAVRQRLRNGAYLFVSLAHGFACIRASGEWSVDLESRAWTDKTDRGFSNI
jgi:hypothetical protein